MDTGNPRLVEIDSGLDTLSDAGHIEQDQAIVKMIRSKTPPASSFLLSAIVTLDKRLKFHDVFEATKLIDEYPGLDTLLASAWESRSFKSIRCLGMSIVGQ